MLCLQVILRKVLEFHGPQWAEDSLWVPVLLTGALEHPGAQGHRPAAPGTADPPKLGGMAKLNVRRPGA
jgi:hypothetical protein